jgi:hypothetical protein
MAFRSNKLGHGFDHGIVCQRNPIFDTRVALGTMMNTMEAVFHFIPQKVRFPFSECQNQSFVMQLPKRHFKSGHNIPHKY